MRKFLVALAALLMIVVAVGLAFALYRLHESRNVRGSSTEEEESRLADVRLRSRAPQGA